MASASHHAFVEAIDQLMLHPWKTAIFTLLFLLTLLRPIVQNFLYLKRPAHFLPLTWAGLLRKPDAAVPLVKLGKSRNYAEALAQGSDLYPDSAYKISHFPHEIVILPPKWVDDIKNCPANALSWQQCSYDLLVGDLTGITSNDLAFHTLLRKDVARLQDRVQDVVSCEGAKATDTEIGPCEDWTATTLFPKLIRVINMMSQLVFVGQPLCRDERWLQSIVVNTAGAFGSVPALWHFNRFIRPLVAWRLSGLRESRRAINKARELLAPVLEQRLKSMAEPGFKAPPDLTQLIIDGIHDSRGRSVDYHIDAQISTGRAGLFTTGTTCFYVLYNLAKRLEYLEPLRQELISLNDVSMDRSSATKLLKLDSFIRECQRWNHLGQIGVMRKVLKPFQLPNGTVLPAGTLLAFSTQNCAFHNSGLEKPYEFDGFHFEKLRALEGNEYKFQAASPSPSHVAFGYGVQSCPGRVFAVHEIKVVVGHIILNYDFKLKSDPARTSMTRSVGLINVTDPKIEFLFKRRS